MNRCNPRLPLVGDRPPGSVSSANPNPKTKTFLRKENQLSLTASRASRWSAPELGNIIGKETHRPIISPGFRLILR
jgi:hypothetical protein